MRHLIKAALLLSALSACGDPTDNAEDCTANEFFDLSSELCLSCPALTLPRCQPGCGFVIERDTNNCPAAACALSCDLCADGERFSEETLACEPIDCGAGMWDTTQQRCVDASAMRT